ncbi:MAG: hypothetical protein WBC05_17400 [Sedimentisphaerales bacterium]
MSSANNIERAIAELNLTTRAETDKRILDDANAALGRAVHKQQPTTDTGIWRMVVRSRIAVPAAAAAMILISFAFFLSTLNKDAVTIEELCGTLGNAGNVCVSTFQADETIPYQQVWTSQSMKMRLFKIGSGNQAQFALWDIPNKVKMTMYLSAVQTQALTEQMLAELEKSVTPLSGISPFSYIRDIPEQARWNRISDPAVSVVVPGSEVYEMVWTQQGTTSELVLYRKWRVFVDARTNLPKRAESYVRSGIEQKYRLESFVIITYPSESEIQDIVRNIFGPRDDRPDDPEYIGTPGAQR